MAAIVMRSLGGVVPSAPRTELGRIIGAAIVADAAPRRNPRRVALTGTLMIDSPLFQAIPAEIRFRPDYRVSFSSPLSIAHKSSLAKVLRDN
jgi:hypothetical protein